MKKIVLLFLLFTSNCNAVTIKATGHITVKIINIEQVAVTEIPDTIVYTENGPTLQVVF